MLESEPGPALSEEVLAEDRGDSGELEANELEAGDDWLGSGELEATELEATELEAGEDNSVPEPSTVGVRLALGLFAALLAGLDSALDRVLLSSCAT